MNNSLNNLTEQSTTKKPFSMKIHPDAFSEVRTNFLSPKPNSSVNPIGKESPLEKENFFLNKSHSFKNEFDSREYKKVFLKKLCLVSLELGLNLLGLINLILMTYYRLGYIDDNYINACLAIEIVMLLFFLAQTFNLLFIGKKRGFFWQIKIEICLNLLMCFQILWMTSHPNFLQVHEDFSILINVIRSFRIFTIKNFSIEIKKIYSLEESETEDTTIQITYFVVDNIINVISAIFIEATLFLALDYMLDFQGYTKLRDHDFEYISSLYFSIVTLSTIGYGDIFPINMWTRLVMIIILFINLSVVSIFLGRLADLIYQISPYKKEYNIKNQMIIIGDVPVSLLRYFLLEIQELDKIQRNLLQLHEKFSLKNVLIVDKKKPTAEQEFLFNDPAFDFDINYLMDNMVNKNWYKLSNIKFAKHVVLFAIDPNDDDSLNTQQDLAMIAMAHRIEAEFNVKITLVLSTDVSENLQRNFSPNVTIISHSLLNNQILANSLENQGFNTWLSHLMTLREKKLPFASEESAAESNFFRLYEYAKNMTQEIYPISFPNFFIGKTFTESAKMIYFADKVLINQEQEKKLDDLLSPQLIQRKDSNKDYCLLLVGVERILPKDEKQKLLLNPINYTIKKGDIAYIIAQNREMANKAIQEFDENPSLSQKYYKTQELYEQDNYIQTSQNFIKELFEKLFLKKKNWEQNISSHPKDDIFDLNMGSSLRGCFKNHIIIKGSLTDFSNIIKIIRFYSDRPVIIFSELEIDFSIWLKIKEKFRNVYYVKGMQHSLNHINELDPQKAYKILVMSSQIRDFLFRDTDSIVFARILVDFFKIKRILIELVDESMVRFLEIRPKFDFISKNQDISFFWPSYVSGNLHYNSLLMSIAARSLYNSNWTLFLKELSVPKIYNEIQLNDENIIKENSNICMLKITKAIANSVIFYGRLQFLLMSNDPCIIALALLKKRKAHKSQIANELIGKLKGNKSYQEESMQKKLINTINSVYGTKFFLTNPVFYTRINEGDKILVLGNKNLTQKLNEKINILAKISIIKVIASPQKKKKKNTELPNSIEKIKKKKIENEIKGKMKENIGQMLKNINDAMKLSLVCYDLFSTLPDKDEVENS